MAFDQAMVDHRRINMDESFATPYRFNGNEEDCETGPHYYGARYYDSRVGRWMRSDPIAARFTWVSPYNYAENRPINGIDLWGLQYVKMEDARFHISQMQTWQSIGTTISSYDAFGTHYIGRSIPVTQHSITMSATEMWGEGAGAGLGEYARVRAEAHQKKVGHKRGRRWGERISAEYAMQVRRSRTVGRGGLVLTIGALAFDAYNAKQSWDEGTIRSNQKGYITSTFRAIAKAINQGFFDGNEQYINGFDLSKIADFLYRGAPIRDPELRAIAQRINEEITKQFREKVVNEESVSSNP